MENQRPLCLFLFLFTLFSITQATKFYVGGSQGWVPKPSESYKQWAKRNKFQVNDSIVFKYKKGADSVLEVKKEDYKKCNKKNPIKKFEEGDTVFKFDRSGPFYFISGKDGHCKKGQKLIVLVRKGGSPAHSPGTKSPSPSPVHHGGSPAHSPGKKPPSPSPVHRGGSPAPSHGAKSPSPANSPVHHGGSPLHSPGAKSPPSSQASPSAK